MSIYHTGDLSKRRKLGSRKSLPGFM